MSVNRPATTGSGLTRRHFCLQAGGVVAGFCAAAFPSRAVRAADTDLREYRLKAAFIFNFIKFVEWSPEAMTSADPTIRVCVAGKQAFQVVHEVIQGKTLKGKTIVVTLYEEVADLRECQVLFVSEPERSRTRGLLDALRRPGVLTVGEVAGFARTGGIINFVTENNRIRFEINPDAAGRASLSISSQLLRVARVVKA